MQTKGENMQDYYAIVELEATLIDEIIDIKNFIVNNPSKYNIDLNCNCVDTKEEEYLYMQLKGELRELITNNPDYIDYVNKELNANLTTEEYLKALNIYIDLKRDTINNPDYGKLLVLECSLTNKLITSQETIGVCSILKRMMYYHLSGELKAFIYDNPDYIAFICNGLGISLTTKEYFDTKMLYVDMQINNNKTDKLGIWR